MSFEIVYAEPAATTFKRLESAAKSAFENRQKSGKKSLLSKKAFLSKSGKQFNTLVKIHVIRL